MLRKTEIKIMYIKISTVILSCLLIFSGCKDVGSNKNEIRSIKADTAKAYGVAGSNTYPGKVVAASEVNMAFRVSGPIAKVNANVGSYVRKGEVIAQIDSRDYEIQLEATKAEYNRIKGEADRIAELYKKGSVTPNDYDKARYGLQQISAKLEAHKNALSDTKLLAPTNGYINKRLFEPGETIGAGIPVLSIITDGVGEVEINIPTSDYIRKEKFDEFFCRADVFPNSTFPLELIGITPKANANQLYTMRFKLKVAGDVKPGPGMSVMVSIKFKDELVQTVSIPISSVFERDGKSMVWIYNTANETVAEQDITITQILTDGTVVVSAGLEVGDVVVTAGVNSIKEGQRVKLITPVSSTNVGGML